MELIQEDLNWCLRVLPEVVFKMLKENPNKVFVSGGFIRSCVSGEKVNDVDIFTGYFGAVARSRPLYRSATYCSLKRED